MDDLISRSALLEEIESLHVTVTGLRTGKGILRRFAKQYKESVLRIISEQPTAYNVDKVVEQINELRAYCDNTDCKECKYKDTCFDKELEKIIKAGGVNG